jgi:hypothetical protein
MGQTARGAFPVLDDTGANWKLLRQYINDVAKRMADAGALYTEGAEADRPAASAARRGTFYLAKDTGDVSVCTGAAWLPVLTDSAAYARSVHRVPVYAPVNSNGWNVTSFVSSLFHGMSHTTADGLVGKWIEYYVDLTPGNWSLLLLHGMNANRGIYTIKLDGTTLGTIDGYASSLTPARSAIDNIIVATAGRKTLRIEINAKNASSTEHFGSLSDLSFVYKAVS